MVETSETILTDRQVEVMEFREQGYTQREVADILGTTSSNVSAIERAAADNIQKAHRTLELVRTLQAPTQFTVSQGTYFHDLVDEVYTQGDENDIKITYSRPELYAHLYEMLAEYAAQNQLKTAAIVGLTTEGHVSVFMDGV